MRIAYLFRVIGQKVLMELSPNSMDNHWIYEIHSI